MNVKESVSLELQAQIKKLKMRLEDLDWLPDLPYRGIVFYGGDNYGVDLPFDRNLMEQMKTEMTNQGFRLIKDVDEKHALEQGDWFVSQVYEKGDYFHRIELCYYTINSGSTCKLNKLGTTVKEMPVYEFSCEPLEDENAQVQQS